ncbi:MAG TPA: DUF6760 family protein [Blastocatellia bacterium]|nr:DUF6760 family protein [Blastocatellia bacterium]
MRARVRIGDGWCGGVLGYPLKALYEEVAFLAYHFHWPPESVLNMEHPDRRRWVQEISAINRRMNGD